MYYHTQLIVLLSSVLLLSHSNATPAITRELVDMHLGGDTVIATSSFTSYDVAVLEKITDLYFASTSAFSTDNNTLTKYRFNNLVACGESNGTTHVTFETWDYIEAVFNIDDSIHTYVIMDSGDKVDIAMNRSMASEINIPVNEVDGYFCLAMEVITSSPSASPSASPISIGSSDSTDDNKIIALGISLSSTNWVLVSIATVLALIAFSMLAYLCYKSMRGGTQRSRSVRDTMDEPRQRRGGPVRRAFNRGPFNRSAPNRSFNQPTYY